jgi:hypothetical protein
VTSLEIDEDGSATAWAKPEQDNDPDVREVANGSPVPEISTVSDTVIFLLNLMDDEAPYICDACEK